MNTCRSTSRHGERTTWFVFVSTEDATMSTIRLETVTTADFLEVIAHTKPSARNLMDKYTAWEREYESV